MCALVKFEFCALDLALMGAFINDVTQILRISDPPPPHSVTLKWLFYLQLYSDCHKRVNPPPLSCVTSFMNAPFTNT